MPLTPRQAGHTQPGTAHSNQTLALTPPTTTITPVGQLIVLRHRRRHGMPLERLGQPLELARDRHVGPRFRRCPRGAAAARWLARAGGPTATP